MKQILSIATTAILLVSIACNEPVKKVLAADAANAIYYGGDIITMEGDSATYAEAVAVKDGKIFFCIANVR